MDIKPIVEGYSGHKIGIWYDISECHYWARKIGFTKDYQYIIPKKDGGLKNA